MDRTDSSTSISGTDCGKYEFQDFLVDVDKHKGEDWEYMLTVKCYSSCKHHPNIK